MKIKSKMIFNILTYNTLTFCFLILISPFTCLQSAEHGTNNEAVVIVESKILTHILKPYEVQKKVIILYVSSPFCPFCRKLEKDILFPMIRSGDYKEKVLLRKFVIDAKQPIINFNNQSQSPKALMAQYNVKTTPTLLFLDLKGNQLNEALIGYSNDEFFWYYLDAAIEKSNQQLLNLAAGTGI
ncbi:MAG: thioredoxin-related protein [Polaribacter sp.]|jgi:thioredoxin-related protein